MGKKLIIKGADFSENGIITLPLIAEGSIIGINNNWVFSPVIDLEAYSSFRIVCESTNATNHRLSGDASLSWFSINARNSPSTLGGYDYYKLKMDDPWENVDTYYEKQERYLKLSAWFGSDETITYKVYAIA